MNSINQKNGCNMYECNQKGCNNIGASNRQMYDTCEYQKRLYESTASLGINLYEGKFENCSKCLYDKFWRPFDLVDVESELKNITRPATRCPQYKYNPDCKKSKSCWSTDDPTVPVVFIPEMCPVVRNNIPKYTHPGYTVPKDNICKRQRERLA